MGCLVVAYYAVVLVLAGLLVQVDGAGPVLALLLIIVAVVVHVVVGRELKKRPQQARREASAGGKPAQAVQRAAAAPAVVSSATQLAPVRIGSRGRQGVAGEHYNRAAVKRVVNGRRLVPVGEWDAGLWETALLVREPRNRHDRNAIAVLMREPGGSLLKVGYLPAQVAPTWQPLLQALEPRGYAPECVALVYRDGTDPKGFQVVLRVPDPEEALFSNSLPPGAVVVPPDRQCAVTGEKVYAETLARHPLGPAWATLHPAAVQSGKYAGQSTIEVRIDGAPIGTLTAAQGQRYATVLTYGPVVACEALIFDGANYREVQLYLPRVD